jgi:hypothetical protein
MKSSLMQSSRAALAVIVLAGAAAPASADWRLTPYTGIQFGGAPNTLDIAELNESFEQRFNIGASVTWTNGGVFGVEVDYNYTPDLFQITEGGQAFDLVEMDSNLHAFMGSVVVNFPTGGSSGPSVSPYIVGGAGMMRAALKIDDFVDLHSNEFGINFGGGVHVFFNDTIGLRGDMRYFRALLNDGEALGEELLDDELGLQDYDFWRATFGVTFRFGG